MTSPVNMRDGEGPSSSFHCPHCNAAVVYARSLEHLGALQCQECQGVFGKDGRRLDAGTQAVVDAVQEVLLGPLVKLGPVSGFVAKLADKLLSLVLGPRDPNKLVRQGSPLGEPPTASERLFYLRRAFQARGLSVHGPDFERARRQVAHSLNVWDPRVGAPAQATGYRDHEPQQRGQPTWSADMAGTGLLGPKRLEITPNQIRCGPAKLDRQRSVCFRIVTERETDVEGAVHELYCVDRDLRKVRLARVAGTHLEPLEQLVANAEEALGWLD